MFALSNVNARTSSIGMAHGGHPDAPALPPWPLQNRPIFLVSPTISVDNLSPWLTPLVVKFVLLPSNWDFSPCNLLRSLFLSLCSSRRALALVSSADSEALPPPPHGANHFSQVFLRVSPPSALGAPSLPLIQHFSASPCQGAWNCPRTAAPASPGRLWELLTEIQAQSWKIFLHQLSRVQREVCIPWEGWDGCWGCIPRDTGSTGVGPFPHSGVRNRWDRSGCSFTEPGHLPELCVLKTLQIRRNFRDVLGFAPVA